MPLFVLETMGRTPGLTGLFLAGVCSSALCSVSAALNSLAAVTLEDYVTVKSRGSFVAAQTGRETTTFTRSRGASRAHLPPSSRPFR